MINNVENVQLLQAFISTAAGFLGVGVGIGVFKGTIKQIKNDLAKVMVRQSKLRGDNGYGPPAYMSRVDCAESRERCVLASSERISAVSDSVDAHSRSIKSLENFARWWMQKEGLKIEEINQILDM